MHDNPRYRVTLLVVERKIPERIMILTIYGNFLLLT